LHHFLHLIVPDNFALVLADRAAAAHAVAVVVRAVAAGVVVVHAVAAGVVVVHAVAGGVVVDHAVALGAAVADAVVRNEPSAELAAYDLGLVPLDAEEVGHRA
jgi:hypothetical protein